MEGPPGRVAGADDRHSANMSRSLKELQRSVKEHEEALNKIQESSRAQQPLGSGQAALASFEVMTAAYKDAAESAPFLPSQESVLPALVAMRRTHNTIAESRSFLASQSTSLEKAKKRLEAEETNLNDQKALQKCLEERIESLRNGLETRMEMTHEEVIQERLDELRLKKKNFDKETAALLKSLNKFIDDHLAPLLAAEELGGPVVGDMMDVDSDGLAAGFSTHGKPKKLTKKDSANPERRQRRIDEIWGSPSARPGAKSRDDWDETAAAGSDMRELTEELLNSLMESGGDTLTSYVRISRDSAVARFLVRSRVAQFHPKDATRLRLVDFGKDLDD